MVASQRAATWPTEDWVRLDASKVIVRPFDVAARAADDAELVDQLRVFQIGRCRALQPQRYAAAPQGRADSAMRFDLRRPDAGGGLRNQVQDECRQRQGYEQA